MATSTLQMKDGSFNTTPWAATTSAANNNPLTAGITVPSGHYAVSVIGPTASANYSISVAGAYKEMNKNGDSFTVFVAVNGETTFQVRSAQSSSVTFSNISRGMLRVVQI